MSGNGMFTRNVRTIRFSQEYTGMLLIFHGYGVKEYYRVPQ